MNKRRLRYKLVLKIRIQTMLKNNIRGNITRRTAIEEGVICLESLLKELNKKGTYNDNY